MNRSEPENRDLFAIADLAEEFGISTRAIRFYESKGLIRPERVGGTRVFRRRDRARLILILRGKRLGFSLRDISDYLSLYDAQSQTAQVTLLHQQGRRTPRPCSKPSLATCKPPSVSYGRSGNWHPSACRPNRSSKAPDWS